MPEPKNDDDDGEFQKCVKFTPDGKFVITGGTDGSCKIFKVSSSISQKLNTVVNPCPPNCRRYRAVPICKFIYINVKS